MNTRTQMASDGQGGPRRMSLQQALKIAAHHQQSGRLQQAESILRQLLQQRPNQPEALHLLALVAHQAGKTAMGVELIGRALSVDPNQGQYQANIAEMYRRIGNPQKAIEHGRKAIALRPDNADSHNNLGIAHYDIGDFDGAIALYDKAIGLKPRFAEAMSNRGNALRNLKRYEEAEADYRRAIAISPSYAEAYNNLGSILRDMERHAESEVAYRKAMQLRPNYVEAMNNLVLALKELKQYDEALKVVQTSLRLMPKNPDALAYAGAVYVDQNKLGQAFDVLKRSLALNPNKAETINMLGRAHFENDEPEQAIACFKKSIEMKPTLADSYNNLGNALKEIGRMDEALGAFDTCLKLKPELVGAYVNLVDAKKFRSNDDKDLLAMERFADRIETLPEERQMHLHFALGKAYDDLKRYDEGFPHLLKGNAMKRKTIDYKEDQILGYFDRIRDVMTKEVIERQTGGGHPSRQPIFVIGMPRSGTTLVEQIIASHPRVRAAGELKDFNDTVMSVRDAHGNQAPYPEFVPVVTPAELGKFAEGYLRKTARRAPGAEFITDKMPSNFYFTGLIHLALPNAKIIHTNRNPVDTCVSCFSKLFAGEQSQTYDLAELGRYYTKYHGLMAHWREVLPEGAFLDVQYEGVVADIETQARRILDYCGLEWDPRVLDFHKTQRSVKTASASQVRQPIYNSSVARWRNYEKFLGPLLAELGPLAS